MLTPPPLLIGPGARSGGERIEAGDAFVGKVRQEGGFAGGQSDVDRGIAVAVAGGGNLGFLGGRYVCAYSIIF